MKDTKEYKQAKEIYLKGGVSATFIAKQFNLRHPNFIRTLRKEGIEVIPKKYVPTFNYKVFDEIDTEEKAYWLGFLYADGSIQRKGNHVEISLKLSDFDHLEKYKNFLESSLMVKKDSFRCRFTVCNEHFNYRLINLGCTNNKSLTLKFPDKNIFKSKDLIRHFIRGYFDGDGGISYTEKCKSTSILGTFEFLTELLTYLPCQKKTFYRDKRWTGNTFGIQYSKIDSVDLLNYLYLDSNIYLDRKYKLFQKFAVHFGDKMDHYRSNSVKAKATRYANTEVNNQITKG
jgi:hypothetical protein